MGSLRSSCTTPASRLALFACLALASSAALGGCTLADPAPAPPLGYATVSSFLPEPAVVQKGIDCPVSLDDFPSNSDTDYPSTPRGSVPNGFVTEKVFICRPGVSEIPGTPNVIAQEELQGDFAPLLAALAVPSERAEGGFACTSVLEYIPVLWLVNASGEAVDAAWPTTECRQASGKPDTQKAIDALSVVDTQTATGAGSKK